MRTLKLSGSVAVGIPIAERPIEILTCALRALGSCFGRLASEPISAKGEGCEHGEATVLPA